MDHNLWIRRINIREAVAFRGTKYYEEKGWRVIKKNKKYYYRFRKEIREKIDHEMLKKIFPKGHSIRDVIIEIKQGSIKFGRYIGSYPIIVGLKNNRLNIGNRVDVRITGHELRSLRGVINQL